MTSKSTGADDREQKAPAGQDNGNSAPLAPADAEGHSTVSDEKVKRDGSGEHGRPTDDTDPGHS